MLPPLIKLQQFILTGSICPIVRRRREVGGEVDPWASYEVCLKIITIITHE